MEDLKDHFYTIWRKLIKLKQQPGEERNMELALLAYDKLQEVERKRLVNDLMRRTKEEIAEEETLFKEILRLRQNEAEMSYERENIMRLLNVHVNTNPPPLPPVDTSAITPTLAALASRAVSQSKTDTSKKKSSMKLSGETPQPKSRKTSVSSVSGTVSGGTTTPIGTPGRFNFPGEPLSARKPNFNVGISVRTQKMLQVKSNIAMRVSSTLQELGIRKCCLAMFRRGYEY